MKIISSLQMRELDRRTIDEFNISGAQLMRTAGEGLAASIKRFAEENQLTQSPILFVAGCGNNGGDAFVAAKILHEEGDFYVELWLAGEESKLKGDALVHFKRMKKSGTPYEVKPNKNDWQIAMAHKTDAEIIVDGLVGTGSRGEPRGVIAPAIEFINSSADQSLILSIDIPSAMMVYADMTVTMGVPKTELVQPESLDFVGNIEVVDIGIPDELLEQVEGDQTIELLYQSDLLPLFPRRPRQAHKGDFGHLLCMGGSKGFSGAIILACKAALRSGVGLVSARVPENIHTIVATTIPELMAHTQQPDQKYTALLLGPGMGRTQQTKETALKHLRESTRPILLDADAIPVMANHTDAIKGAKCPVIITPHPGEFATLLGIKPQEVQEDRHEMARMAAQNLNCTVVLKGAGTVIASPNTPLIINTTGNPGMAKGGCGDLLAGLMAGLLAQGIPPRESAAAAVWLHGRIGDLTTTETSQASTTPTDMLEKLPHAFREISCR